MKRLLAVGLILVGFIYGVPLLYMNYEELPLPPAAAVAAETAETPETALADVSSLAGEDITLQRDGETVILPLEAYVAGVVAAEIPADFPQEALRAQAVAARTYAVYKQRIGHPAQHPNADVCDDPAHCTAYIDLKQEAQTLWGDDAAEYEDAIVRAAADTAGEVVTCEGRPIVAVFCAASTSHTESAADVWGREIPYLVSVESEGETDCPQYRDEVTWTAADFKAAAEREWAGLDLSGTPDSWFGAIVPTGAGGVKTIEFGGVPVDGAAMRALAGLRSTHFTVDTTADSVIFRTEGYGHGVGLSQWGARRMAENGSDYRAILAHYYTNTKIEKLNALQV